MEKSFTPRKENTLFAGYITPLIERLKASQTQLTGWQHEHATFVPLAGCDNPSYKGSMSLDNEFQTFFTDENQHLLLLAGHSGAGKSLVTQRLIANLWKRYQLGDPIPLWISLPNCKDPETQVIEETLEKAGFDASHIEQLKSTQQFIVVLDAYDEIHCLKNLYVSNKLQQWNAKVIVTCRHEYLYFLDNFKPLFAPYNGNNPDYARSTVLYVKPFNVNQIVQYIKQYLKSRPDAAWKTSKQYQQAINNIHGVRKLIENPYVLTLAVQALPEISKRYEAIENEADKRALTRAVLYDVFIEHWFARQEHKLKANHTIKATEDIKPQFWAYAKGLAQIMHEHKITQIYYDVEDDGDLFDSEEESPFSEFFNPDDPKLQILQSSCLIREMSPKHYGFVHNSLLEYFLTRELYDTLKNENPSSATNNAQNQLGNENTNREEPTKKKSYFNERLLVEEGRVIQFLADRVSEDEGFKQQLLRLLYSSKDNPENKLCAANAVTVLVKAFVAFNGADLSGVQIPGANLTGGYFDQANFQKADLSDVKCPQIWLRNANLQNAKVSGLTFGEVPFLNHNDFNTINMHDIDYCDQKGWLLVGLPHSLVVWDLFKHTKVIVLRECSEQIIESVRVSPDGLKIASASDHVRVWSVMTGECEMVFDKHKSSVKKIDYSHCGQFIASLDKNNNVYVWDVNTGNIVSSCDHQGSEIHALSISPAQKHIATANSDNLICIWSYETNKYLNKFHGHKKKMTCLRFSPDGNRLASGSADKTVAIWDVESGTLLASYVGHKNTINDICFNSSGEMIVSASNDYTACVWSLKNKDYRRFIYGHRDYVSGVRFGVDDNVITGSWDGTVRIHKFLSEFKNIENLNEHNDIGSIKIGSSGYCMIYSHGSPEEDNTVCVRFLDSIHKQKVFYGHKGHIWQVAISADEHYCASVGKDNMVRVWDISSGQNIMNLAGHKDTITCVCFSSNGEYIASGGEDNSVRVWSFKDKRQVLCKMYDRVVFSVCFSPDDAYLASSGLDEFIHIIPVDNGKLITKLMLETDAVTSLKFSTGNKYIAAACCEVTTQIISMETQEIVNVFEGTAGAMGSSHVHFSNDARHVIVLENQECVVGWEIETGHCSFTLNLPTTPLCMSYHNDEFMALGFKDGSIQIWHNVSDKNQYNWLLHYSSYSENPYLFLSNIDYENIDGMSSQNYKLFAQHNGNTNEIFEASFDFARSRMRKGVFATTGSVFDKPMEERKLVPALHSAVSNNDISEVIQLVKNRVDVNHSLSSGETALHIAAKNGFLKICRILMQYGADVNRKKDNGVTPLYSAAYCGHLDVVICLDTNGAAINRAANGGWSPLYVAVTDGNLEVVKYLITQGADLRQTPQANWSLLHEAVSKRHVDIVKYLITCDIDVNQQNNAGATPLYIAASKGYHKIVFYLIERKANLNKAVKSGCSPLHIALKKNHFDCFALLVENNVDLDQPNEIGKTALFTSAIAGQINFVECILKATKRIDLTDLWEILTHYETVKNKAQNKINLSVLYDLYLSCWFSQQADTHSEVHDAKNDITPLHFWTYSKHLARCIYDAIQNKVFFDSSEKDIQLGVVFDLDHSLIKSLKKIGLIHAVSANSFSFIHNSLLYYFIARDIYDNYLEDELENTQSSTEDKSVSAPTDAEKSVSGIHYFNKKLLVEDGLIIEFLAGMAMQDKQFKAWLLNQLYDSKHKPENKISAANAITILVKAKVSFNGADLRHIKIPHATLSGGYFSFTNFQGADLSNVKLINAYLGQADLKNCNLDGVKFGEYAWFKHANIVNDLDYRPDVNRMATASSQTIYLWNVQENRCIKSFLGHTDIITSVHFDKYGTHIVSGSRDMTIRIWEVESGKCKKVLHAHNGSVNCVRYSRDDQWLVSCGQDGNLITWDLLNDKPTFISKDVRMSCVDLNNSKTKLVFGTFSCEIIDLQTNKHMQLKGCTGTRSVQFSHDNTFLVAGGCGDYAIRVNDAINGQCVKVLKGHENEVNSVKLSRFGNRVVSGSNDGTIRVWDVASGTSTDVRKHPGAVKCVGISEDGTQIAFGGSNEIVRLINVEPRGSVPMCAGLGKMNDAHITNNSNLIVSGNSEGDLLFWDLVSGVCVKIHHVGKQSIDRVCFDDSGTKVAFGSDDGNVRLLDIESGESNLLHEHNCIYSLVYSNNGTFIATGGGDGNICHWNLAAATATVLRGHHGPVYCVNYSHDDKAIASGGLDMSVRIWDLRNGVASVLKGHEGAVNCLQYSNNGKMIVTGSSDKTIRVWDITTGTATVFRGHHGSVADVKIVCNDTCIISGSEDKTLRLWDVAHVQQIRVIIFPASICAISLDQSRGVFAIVLDDGVVQCWRRVDDAWQTLQLQWSSDSVSNSLFLSDCNTIGSTGLSLQNHQLLKQRGAIVDQSLSELSRIVASRTGSPLHQRTEAAAEDEHTNQPERIVTEGEW